MTTVKNSGFISSNIFDVAYASKQEGLKEGYYTHALWDATAFSSVREKLGGNIRLMVTGSAPIAPYVMEFLRICFACPVVEGYGQTECSAACTTTPIDETEIGNVGIPFASCEIKLVDVPSMNYLHTDRPNPRGEVCFRGPICCKGYYKEPQKTTELIDKEGWYHSGDVGEFLPDGSLRIVDRVKNIFKLSHGEYIAPEKIENSYLQSPYVAQIYVHGESIKSCLVAIIVPSTDNLLQWASQNNKPQDLTKLCQDPQVNAMILKDMEEVGKNEKLRGFEVVKAIFLTDKPFSPSDILTPTFKIKRPQAAALFKQQIADMYDALPK
jgi:long-chain acyl-CoA synthetase